jgi:hypothetical protein
MEEMDRHPGLSIAGRLVSSSKGDDERMNHRPSHRPWRAAAIAFLPLAGCFVQTGGSLGGDALSDPAHDSTVDTAGDVTLDTTPGDTLDEDGHWPDAVLDPVEPTDVDPGDPTDVVPDTGTDIPFDPPLDTSPGDVGDPPAEDAVTDPGECTTTWDPACDDGNECTADFCDLATNECQHSGATMEGTGCTDDGNECTDDYCHGGVCVHDAYREGEFCDDDGNVCTDDYCQGGTCIHDGTPRNGDSCAGDGESCTDDVCQGGVCTHEWRPECCHTDGDCIEPGSYDECGSSDLCYTPPEGQFCEECHSREECGDGGGDSDDFCIWDGDARGCGTDCASDYDCPRGSRCYADVGADPPTPCSGDPDCLCYVLVGDCETWRSWGDACEKDDDCDGPANYCFDDYCTWACSSDAECPLESSGCDVGGNCRK